MTIVNRRRILLFYFLFVLFLTAGCHKNSTSISGIGLIIEGCDHSLVITNYNGSAVHFLLVERGAAMLIDWYPACKMDAPNRIDPKKSIEISYEDVHGYFEQCEIIVYWWFCVKQTGKDEYAYDMIRSEVIQTK